MKKGLLSGPYLLWMALFTVIPLIIVGYVAPAIADVGRGAKKLLILTCLVAYLATVISGLIGYFCGASLFPMLIGGLSHTCDEVAGGAAEPYFTISIPPSCWE